MTSHNIVGSEAIHDPRDRLVHFCHVHGSIQAFPRRPGPALRLALTFAAGGVAALAVAALALLA